MAKDDQGISLRDVVGHIQALKQDMLQRFENVALTLTKRIDALEQKVDRGFERVEGKIDLLSTQIKNIDERLDVIEVKRLPVLEAQTR